MLNSEEIKPVAIAIIKLRLSERISQSVSQSVDQSVRRKFNLIQNFQNFVKAFWNGLGMI